MTLRRGLAVGTGSLLLAACQAAPMPVAAPPVPAQAAPEGAGGATRQLQGLGLKLRGLGVDLCLGLGQPCPSPGASSAPSASPSASPSAAPSPSASPSPAPTFLPSLWPSAQPSSSPTPAPSATPSPTAAPSSTPSPVQLLPGHITAFAVDPQGGLYLFGLDANVDPNAPRENESGRVVLLRPNQSPLMVDDRTTEVGQADSGQNTLNFFTSGVSIFSAWKRLQYGSGALEAGEFESGKSWRHHAVGTMRPSDERYFVALGDASAGGLWQLVDQFGASPQLVVNGPAHLRPTGFEWTGNRPVWASASGLVAPGANASATPVVQDNSPIFSIVADGSGYLATDYGYANSQSLLRLVPGQGAVPVLTLSDAQPYRVHRGGNGKRYLMSVRHQGQLQNQQAGDQDVRIQEILKAPDGSLSLADQPLFATF